MKYIVNAKAIILFLDNKSVRVEKTDARYPKIIKFFELPAEDQEDYVKGQLAPASVKLTSIHGKDGFEVVGEDVYYKGEVLPNALATKIRSIVREGLPVTHFEKFWENLSENPSATSVSELLEFLEYKELPITEDGYFIAYKGVSADLYSIHGNSKTKVLKGTVDGAGRIYNGVGEEIVVTRREVDDNREKHCSYGLHVGSLDYASSFGSGGVLLVVKVNPKDVVSVPSDYSCQKCRVSAYKVTSIYEGEITSPVVDADGGETIVPNARKDRNEFIDKIETYLDNKRSEGWDEVSIRQIQNACSPDYPSKNTVFEALQELCENWYVDDDGVTVVEL
jgi:hypothetical protein